MTEKQRRFAEAYARDPNATSAAVAAGYSPKTAYSCGQRLLKNDEVKACLHAILDTEHSKAVASAEEIRRFWSRIMNDTTEKTVSRLKASELLARSCGMFLADSAVTTGTDSETSSVVIYFPELEKLPSEEEDVVDVDAAEDQPAGPRLIE